jgi:signal transduction histidine kinase
LYQASRGVAPELTHTPQDLVLIATQAQAWAEGPAVEKGLSIVAELSSRPLMIMGDGDALLSVLANLVSNAIRYTPSGGQVTIRTGGDAAQVWAEVADTGIGMSAETQAHIFEKFYRAPEARAVEAQGLGLGLALAHQLVQAHQGSLTVTSAVGEGSTFRVSLPGLEDATAPLASVQA